jgi:hypothetical protein
VTGDSYTFLSVAVSFQKSQDELAALLSAYQSKLSSVSSPVADVGVLIAPDWSRYGGDRG